MLLELPRSKGGLRGLRYRTVDARASCSSRSRNYAKVAVWRECIGGLPFTCAFMKMDCVSPAGVGWRHETTGGWTVQVVRFGRWTAAWPLNLGLACLPWWGSDVERPGHPLGRPAPAAGAHCSRQQLRAHLPVGVRPLKARRSPDRPYDNDMGGKQP
jgi:hypothetical protein